MNIPTLEKTKELLAEAQQLNPGPWVQHSIHVAEAAHAIATPHPDLDPDVAFILGYLHDIGRRAGVTDMRHILDGYTFLHDLGYEDAAQICLTHSFVLRDINSVAGKWDCTPQELDFIQGYMDAVQMTDYDRLIQLCDALALATGFSLIEKRLMDVTLRRGFNEFTLARWREYLALQQQFEAKIGCSIYSRLPGVVENTFGTNLTT